jgi:hypothetical protein
MRCLRTAQQRQADWDACRATWSDSAVLVVVVEVTRGTDDISIWRACAGRAFTHTIHSSAPYCGMW